MAQKRSAKKGVSPRISGASVLTQEDADKFAKDAKRYAKTATTSKKKARDTLISLGIYTPSGKLSKKYS